MSRRIVDVFCGVCLLTGLFLIGWMYINPVLIMENGQPRLAYTLGLTVADALQAAGMTLSPDDLVFPGVDEWIPESGPILLVRPAQVILWDDGNTYLLRTHERNPANLFGLAGIRIYPGDRIFWDSQIVNLEKPIEGNQNLVLWLRRGFLVKLSEGDRQIEFYTGEDTLKAALSQAGIHLTEADWVSMDLDTPVDRPMAVKVIRPRELWVQVDHLNVKISSAAPSIGTALTRAGLILQPLDYTLPPVDQPLPENGLIRVVRVKEERLSKQIAIPFKVMTQASADIELDQKKVLVSGQEGIRMIQERVRYEDGQEIARTVEKEWIERQPRDQINGVGTKVILRSIASPFGTIQYWRAASMYAVSYSPCRVGTDQCSSKTASGQPLQKGVAAVSLSLYNQLKGLQIYVPGYGIATIADAHGAPTSWIDLGYSDDDFVGWHQNVTVYFLPPVPVNTQWTIP